MANSNISLTSLQQRITQLKAHSTANLTAEMTDYTSDRDWLAKILEDGNQPEDWLEYLKAIEKRGNNDASSLNIMYNKAIHDIPVHKHKKNDNYATILINSARLRASQDVDEARTLFKFARANVRFLARIHVAAAQLEHDIGNISKSMSVLRKGIEVGAWPSELLHTALDRLKAGEKVLNPEDNGLIVSGMSTTKEHEQKTTATSQVEPSRTTTNATQEHGEESSNSVSYLQVDNTVSFKKRQRNPSDSGADDTDNTLWLNRQTHLSQSATKHTRITPLSKPPLTSASTVGKRKMRALGAPMRIKRELVLPDLQEDVKDPNKHFLHGIAPLNDVPLRSDCSDVTDTSLHNTLPSLTFSMLGKSEVENNTANQRKKTTTCKLFPSPNKNVADNHQVPEMSLGHTRMTSELQKPSEPVSNVSPPGIGSLPHHSDARKAQSTTVALAMTPDLNPVPPPTHAALVISPPPVSSITSTMVAPALAPVITPAPVISPPPVVIAAPVPAPAVVPTPVVQSTPQPQITQPPMQADQSKNMIYVNNKQYTILKLIGKGGSSKVYQVYSADVKNVLAIKRVDLELADDLTKQGYINEITLLTRLQKKTEKIIKLYDFQITDSLIVMVMECGSIDLSTFLRRNKNIREDKIRFYWHEMLEAVHVIHQEGIVHSDLKPANFLFVEATLKLIDFGIANAIQVDQTSVLRDQQIGTLNYMSPEAIQDTSPTPAMDSSGRRKPRLKINCQSDVWSLGCILYYMVYGKTPFQHITNGLMKLHAIIDPSHEINFPAISNKDLYDVLQKCLIRNPKERPSIETLLKHPFLRNKTQDELASSTNSGMCDFSASQLQALISQLSSVRVHSPKSLSAISKAKGLIEQLTKKSGISDTPAELEQAISGSHPASLPVIETAPSMSAGVFPLSQPPMKQAKMSARQPLQSVNMVDVQKVQTNLKSGTSTSSAGLKHRHEINDKENLGMRESMVNSQ
ncbi:dual specificity protein kinase Ttk-like isoform X2 [Anneissia japonica]|uniref:dual specificity protein kinase Ttk-like isoform X2 n=1 Tax=Anneissia japonica TaxID=1529436 RepID=UPI001425A5F9|nr:dual specificity protein kinase Ttk-like isoform X2 [Anneissia japonica]